MTSPSAASDDRDLRLMRAEAALWVTRLHGPGRDAQLETSFRRWLAADPRHAAAFELATDAWQGSGNLSTLLPIRPERSAPRGARRLVFSAFASAALACIVCVAVLRFTHDGALVTGPGETRTIALSDGTSVTMNANSRLLVEYDEHVRKVILAAGEALFDVMKHEPRPFAVVIGDRKVIAIGTSFLIRREQAAGSAFAVTLLEGRIAVEPLSSPDALPKEAALAEVNVLHPGERLRIARNVKPTLDSPSIEKITAWQRGQLIFDDVSMSEAAAEFNRYGSDRLVLDGEGVGKIRVGGVFRIADPAAFAQAIADAHHLRIVRRDHEIVMSGVSGQSAGRGPQN